MKIVIPVDDKTMDTNVCISFGRTPYFLIYDTESKESTFLDNEAASSQGGAGILAAQSIVDKGADALLTPRCGQNAADVINAANIKIYKTIGDSLKDNLYAFNKGELKLLSEIHSGFHNHGGK
jgi:predicted Fe-Mo cluster-binding NifX family protein